jgi:hypothetical protein
MFYNQSVPPLGQDVLRLAWSPATRRDADFDLTGRAHPCHHIGQRPAVPHSVTGGIPAPEADPPPDYCADRTAMMPKRQRTRAQNRAHRIATERRRNRAARMIPHAEYSNAGPAPPHTDNDPRPF